MGRNRGSWLLVVVLLVLAGCSPARNAPSASAPAPPGEEAHGTAEELGTVNFAVSCTPEAQGEFNRGAALLHSFWFAPAIESFNKVVELDTTCGMGHWGVAMSLLGNPFAWPLTGSALTDGGAAVQKAVAAGARTPREEAYIAAIGTFYRDAETVDHRRRALAYAEAMGRLVQEYPDDSEAKIFYALALDATALPTDKSYSNQLEAGDILGKAFVEQPNHPGVAHYLIHSYDHPPIAARGREAARRYAEIAPSAPHALHMPSHIFTRLGDWQESIGSNAASVESAQDEISAGHRQGAGSYNALHALDYLMYANLQLARDRAAQGVLDEIKAIERLDVENFSAAYAFAAIPARHILERGLWAEARGLTLHPAGLAWDRFPQAEAVSVFARGLGAARSGDAAGGRAALDRLGTLRQVLLGTKQDYWAGQADIQSRAIAAWVALGEGQKEEARELMSGAADAEAATEKHPVMPGPLVPARELLGEMLLALDQPVQALREFESSHRIEPNRFRGLYGAAVAAERTGDLARASAYYERLVELTKGAESGRPELSAAEAFLAKNER